LAFRIQAGAAWDIPFHHGIVRLNEQALLRTHHASGHTIRFGLTGVGACEEKHEARQRALKKKQVSDVERDDDHEEVRQPLMRFAEDTVFLLSATAFSVSAVFTAVIARMGFRDDDAACQA
jgi:hypothetical protein